MKLLIVESPAKSKTLGKYLGKDFKIIASYGHVRDLRSKNGAVDPDNKFAMQYETDEKKDKYVKIILTEIVKAKELYLAMDPDREGEAIAWHILELLKERNKLKGMPVYRVAFNEITKTAVQAAVANPRDIDMNLVNAQQARRALDYLVGFNLSPLLWKKVRPKLSAGRVQSPALRLIVERQAAIDAFNSQEYWTIEADLNAKKKNFVAKLAEYQGTKLEQFTINNTKQAESAVAELLAKADGTLIVHKITKSKRKRNPAAPFITSTLQQEAARKLHFAAHRTMRTAQQLYEAGLITYMRTDSVNLAAEALEAIRALIAERYGADCVPKAPRAFKSRAKNAQEAHEAIRPADVTVVPGDLKAKLAPEQFKLYDLIWKRTIACQMIHATFDQVALDLLCTADDTANRFRANGSTITIPGFLQVYEEGKDDSDKKDTDDGEGKLLPPLKQGDSITLEKIRPEQHFTEPPPKFSEASLVKALEEYGIGRPSTYASIISTLQTREYVESVSRRFTPTDVGKVVSNFLSKYLTQYVDYDFTAKLEDSLDDVANGKKDWLKLLKNFWQPFIDKVNDIEANVQRKDVTQEKIDEKCPKCNADLSARLGRRGKFIGCTAYPECDYTRSMDGEEQSSEPEVVPDRSCPKCESGLVYKHGKYGKFIGCSNYPKCKFIESLNKPEDLDIICPKCNVYSVELFK
ncbi:MAG: DNA topoisomerase I [Legionellales bacterium]|nr:MAG: DNA topoisomerase I [Legionellales bacterium]